MDRSDIRPKTLTFYLNGEKVTLENVAPTLLLADYLRGAHRTGTKVACGEGGCGACTVMLSRLDPATGRVEHLAVHACLRPLCSVDGMAVTTVEGVGNVRNGLDPVQHRIAAGNGSQCGFCTPGFVMNMYTLLRNRPRPTAEEIENLFDGNLCRCTGYRAILQSLRTFADDAGPARDTPPRDALDASYRSPTGGEPVAENGACRWYRPANLEQVYQCVAQAYRSMPADKRIDIHKVMLVVGHTSIGVCDSRAEVFVDVSRLPELTGIESSAAGPAGIRCGASVSIERLLDELRSRTATLPANATSGLSAFCDLAGQIGSLQVRNTGSVAGNVFLAKSFEHFYQAVPEWHPSIRDTFVSDLMTALALLDATVRIHYVPLSETEKSSEEQFPILEIPPLVTDPNDRFPVFLDFSLPDGKPGEIARAYKVARREQNGQALVNAGFRVRFGDDGKVAEVRVVYGGLGENSLRLEKTETFLTGRTWDEETLRTALTGDLSTEIEKSTRKRPGAAAVADRVALAQALFYRFFLDVALERDPDSVEAVNRSGARALARALSSGTQSFPEYPATYPVGKPTVKQDAFLQATGEAKYTHDIPLPPRGLHAVLVTSDRAAAWFGFSVENKVVDVAVLKDRLRETFADFVDLVTSVDVPGNVGIGPANDDPVFVPYNPAVRDDEDEDLHASWNVATCVGAPIGLIVAETEATARAAARYVEAKCISYEDVLEYCYEGEKVPVVISLGEAVQKDSRFPQRPKTFQQLTSIAAITRPSGDADGYKLPRTPPAGSAGVQGSMRTGAQAQFYLETQAALVVPTEDEQLTVHVSTQNPAGDQAAVARVLGLPASHVHVVVKRIGGGFGGKQTRSAFVSGAAAVAAWKHRRPVRVVLPRKTDLTTVGKRHPFLGEYNVAYTPDGTIKAWTTTFRSDGGNTYDMSFPIMDLAQLLGDNVYNVEKYRTEGVVYRTNKASNTAMRSFGTIQAILIQENAIEHVAHALSREQGRRVLPEEIRRKNFYRTGTPESSDKTPYGQHLTDCNIREIWADLWQSCEFEKRDREIREFNQANRWKKRGISMIPLKYGISYTGPRGTLDQGYALVNAYNQDGSVLVLCGGVEMGQGLSTKMAQVAARTLGIPLAKVTVGRCDTDAVPNSSPTAASTGSDLNGGAVYRACKALRKRLQEFCINREMHVPIQGWQADWAKSWPKVVREAYASRINLSSQAHYKTPHYSAVTRDKPEGHPFLYFTYSAAAAEVEVDVLTGQWTIRRADVLYDMGRSLNPLIDVGQIEGAFVQGVGCVTTEEVDFDADGRLLNDRLWSYKPPLSCDIPLDFRVRIRKDDTPATPAQRAVMSSKGIGEPPFVLAASVFFAIRHAVADARKDQGSQEWFEMDAPATVVRIREKCGVKVGNMNL